MNDQLTDLVVSELCKKSLTRYTKETIAEGLDNNGAKKTVPWELGEIVNVDLVCFCEDCGFRGSDELKKYRMLGAVILKRGFRFVRFD